MPQLSSNFPRPHVSRSNSLPSQSQSSLDLTNFEVKELEPQLSASINLPLIVHHMQPNASYTPSDSAREEETQLTLIASDTGDFASYPPLLNVTDYSLFDAQTTANSSSILANGSGPNCTKNLASCPVAHFVQVVADSYADYFY